MRVLLEEMEKNILQITLIVHIFAKRLLRNIIKYNDLEDLIIIIVNWNGDKYIDDCLRSVFNAIIYCNYKISLVVIDNNSRDNSRKMMYELIKYLLTIILDLLQQTT